MFHGVSNRLTGGPANVSCLGNSEQAGEGWSDYMALMITTNWATASINDGFNIKRPIGNYAFGYPTTGPGIRAYPYSTNMTVNPLTYSDVPAAVVPHGVGTVFCTALWEMTWQLIQTAGITSNVFNSSGTGGNVIAFKLVMEGLKLQPCSPGFLNARDAILQADVNLYGGAHTCAIWTAFAKRGMGFSAVQGSSSNNNDQTPAFDLPPACLATTAPVVTINQAAAQADPTSTSPINFTVVFDQPVTGFATGDVSLAGTAGATTGTVTGGPTTYNVAVSGMTSCGTVIATIPAGVCQNASAQTNVASTSTDNTVTFNLAAPNVTINQVAAQADPTGATPIIFTAVFDQAVTGFATGDVTLSGTAGANSAVVSGGPTTYTITVSGMTGTGTVIPSIAAGVCQNACAQTNTASTSTDNSVTYNAPATCTNVDPVPNQIVCNNSATTAVNFTSGTPGTTFSWVNNTPSIGLAANGTGNIPSFIATNATAAPVVATITVTPVLTVVTPTTTTFNFTGAAQTFTVPTGVTSINFTALGAEGGSGATGTNNGGTVAGGAGGRGSRATGTLAVTPGQVLNIFVGGAGGTPTAGFNGGGTGGNANAGGGGGASDVRFPGAATADRILTAAGGGGGGRGGCEGILGAPGAGGAGGNGDGNGSNGANSGTFGGGFAGGGFGAIGTAFGAEGIGCAGFLGAPGIAASGAAGGNGGAGQSCCCFNFQSIPGGGGGGGGQLGGGGGGGGSAGTVACQGNDKGAGGGGAGGTSYTGGVTAGAITTNIQTGNGQVVLNYNVTTVCNGPTSAFTITVNPTATVNVIAPQTLCAGSPTTAVNFTSPTPNVVFNWTNNTPAIGLAAAGTGNIPSFIAQNLGNTPLVATITVTPLVPVGGSIPGGPVSFTNTASIAIPGTGTGSGTGSAANPYPSNISVSGLPTTGVSVQSVTLTNIQHTWSDDIGVLLVGPGGQKFVPMARVGGSGGFDASATVILRDGSPAMPTGTAAIPSGTYAPTAGAAGAIWPAPAPAAPYSYPAPNGSATFANTFNTTSNYNGTWSLYVTDMAAGDVGTIAGGWGITLVTPTIPAPGCNGTPRTFTITVNPNPAIVIIADPGTTLCEGDPTLLTVVTGTASPIGTLYTQTGTAGASPNSQAFEPANVLFNNQAAEDFVVPAGSTWTISQVSANGLYFNGAGPSTSFNVSFYNNAGGIPGSLVASYTNLAYTGGASPWYHRSQYRVTWVHTGYYPV
ncbi:MAG: M36 family metallopeptidase [Chitinophagaceae bacterium]|nr:M36 family metallopeptidase [Chitinophagaceae bacterium]